MPHSSKTSQKCAIIIMVRLGCDEPWAFKSGARWSKTWHRALCCLGLKFATLGNMVIFNVRFLGYGHSKMYQAMFGYLTPLPPCQWIREGYRSRCLARRGYAHPLTGRLRYNMSDLGAATHKTCFSAKCSTEVWQALERREPSFPLSTECLQDVDTLGRCKA